MYEYSFMSQLMDFGDPAKFAKLTDQEREIVIARAFSTRGTTVTNAVRTFPDPGGPWEIVSHAFLPHGRFVVLSFLLRRPAPPPTALPAPEGPRGNA